MLFSEFLDYCEFGTLLKIYVDHVVYYVEVSPNGLIDLRSDIIDFGKVEAMNVTQFGYEEGYIYVDLYDKRGEEHEEEN